MSSENIIAGRSAPGAGHEATDREQAALGTAAVVVGGVAVLVSPISILGWIAGVTALGMGTAAALRPVSTRQGSTALALGAVAILISAAFFAMHIAQG
jgi:hypothetical protein